MSTDQPLPHWTIFDWLKSDARPGTAAAMFQHDVDIMVEILRSRGSGSLTAVSEDFIGRSANLAAAKKRMFSQGRRVTVEMVSGYTAMFAYLALAMDRGYQLWALTDNAVAELFGTRIPDRIYRERLPSLPSESTMLVFPQGSLQQAMSHEMVRRETKQITMRDTESFARRTTMKAQSILVNETAPNRAWRGVVMTSAKDGPDSISSYFFSVDISLPGSLGILDGPLGHLLVNLFLCHENRETIRVPVTPHFPGRPGGKKHSRAKRQKSGEPYVLIDISEPERVPEESQDEDGGSLSERSPKGHWVRAHWHRYWVRKPDRPWERQRVNRYGNTLYLIKKRIARHWAGSEEDREGLQRTVKVTAQPGRGLAWDP